jgi:hypothetical protein
VVVDVQGDKVSGQVYGLVKKAGGDDFHTEYGLTTIEQFSFTKTKKE